MHKHNWTQQLRGLFFQALDKYRSGQREAETFFNEAETSILSHIGLRPIHVYDFIEDMAGGAQMEWEDFLLIAAARRDYFLYMLEGLWPSHFIPESELPLREDTWEGIAWLPRITVKARCFLEGTLAPDVMFFCGGDRRFLASVDLHPADFLRAVWASRGDENRVGQFVQGIADG